MYFQVEITVLMYSSVTGCFVLVLSLFYAIIFTGILYDVEIHFPFVIYRKLQAHHHQCHHLHYQPSMPTQEVTGLTHGHLQVVVVVVAVIMLGMPTHRRPMLVLKRRLKDQCPSRFVYL